MQVAGIFAMSNEEIESMQTPNDVIPDGLSGGLSYGLSGGLSDGLSGGLSGGLSDGLSGGLSYGLSDASFLMFW